LPIILSGADDGGNEAAQIVEPLVKKYGVSIREMTVMKLVDGQTMNQQAIATLLSISRNAVVDVVDSLELKELARRQKNPENRREQFITLTPKGEKVLIRLEPAQIAYPVLGGYGLV
jgi:MarR family transcriptional regulator for hemolysin